MHILVQIHMNMLNYRAFTSDLLVCALICTQKCKYVHIHRQILVLSLDLPPNALKCACFCANGCKSLEYAHISRLLCIETSICTKLYL